MQPDFNEALPIYEQIIDRIKKSIACGDYMPGDKLPSQREMARQLGVNPNTIQRAYREMEHRGLVETKRGRGTFIMDSQEIVRDINEEMAREAINNFTEEMFSLGFTPREIIEKVKAALQE